MKRTAVLLALMLLGGGHIGGFTAVPGAAAQGTSATHEASVKPGDGQQQGDAVATDCEAVAEQSDHDPWKARRQRYRTIIERAGERYGVDPALIDAVITVESGYNPRSVNRRTGAAGLMQLMPETARRYGVKNVFDPAQNIRGGAKYLAELLDMFDNDEKLALAAYLAGEGAVQKYGRIPPFRAAQHYVPKVIGYYRKLRCAT